MKNYQFFPKVAAFAALMFFIPGCESEQALNESPQTEKRKNDVPTMDFYALAGGTILDRFSTSDPETILNSAPITGLMANELILAIDFRPATGQLYGLGSTSRIYVINPETGTSRAIGTGPFSPALEGEVAGFDFNPTVDRIRVVTSSGQNLRLNPETGTVAATDLPINGVSGAQVSAVAYTSNFAGSSATVLYDIDLATRKLYKQLPPNDGTLVEVGDLDLNIEGEGGFDISHYQDVALGMFEVNKKSTLFSVDLQTGKANIIAKYDKALKYSGIAIPTRPVAYAVTSANSLLIFNPENPASTVSKSINVPAGETILGIDFRPVNGQLYALSSASRLYTINASSGAATAVGAVFTTALSGSDFGFDFNPLVDRIRIVSNNGQNLRVNPNDGAVITDGNLNPGSPVVTAAAYTNNFAGTTTTSLFDIDVATDKLYQQNPPNAGTLVEIGSLGKNVDAATGFDIGGTSGIAYAILTSGGSSMLYEINKTNGSAMAKGPFASSVNGFTVGLGF